MNARYVSKRITNTLRKLSVGLRPHSESICPSVRTDLYYAHLSIYWFASEYVRGGRALDLGCGAGYGASVFTAAGAAEVVGVDIDPWNIRYARRHFGRPNVKFMRASAEDPPPLGKFDMIVSSNVFEHLLNVDAALTHARAMLSSTGKFILALPPIFDLTSLAANQANHHHRANYHVMEWLERLRRHFADVATIRHWLRDGVVVDFGSPFEDRVSLSDFTFTPIAVERYLQQPTITAIFIAQP